MGVVAVWATVLRFIAWKGFMGEASLMVGIASAGWLGSCPTGTRMLRVGFMFAWGDGEPFNGNAPRLLDFRWNRSLDDRWEQRKQRES